MLFAKTNYAKWGSGYLWKPLQNIKEKPGKLLRDSSNFIANMNGK